MLLVNALGLGKGDEESETTAEPSWMHGFLSMLTGLLCAIGGLIFLVRVAQRRQPHDAVLQQVAEAPNQQRDPAVMNEMDTESDELDESAEPILNAERGTENAPASTDHAGDLARLLRHHGIPPAYARYSPEHMILWMIIRGRANCPPCWDKPWETLDFASESPYRATSACANVHRSNGATASYDDNAGCR